MGDPIIVSRDELEARQKAMAELGRDRRFHDTAPPGWVTLDDLARNAGVSPSTIRRWLQEHRDAGNKVRRVRVRNSVGTPTPYYDPLEAVPAILARVEE